MLSRLLRQASFCAEVRARARYRASRALRSPSSHTARSFALRPSAALLNRLTPERRALVSRGAPAENLPPGELRAELEAMGADDLRLLLRAKEQREAEAARRPRL